MVGHSGGKKQERDYWRDKEVRLALEKRFGGGDEVRAGWRKEKR